MTRFLGYGRQTIDEDDVAAVVSTLVGDFLTQGPAVERFEKGIAEYLGAKHVIAVSSGTAALHIACLAAGLGPGDHGVTQPLTFVASANAQLYCGASCGLVEIDPDSLMMSPRGLEAYLAARPETKVVIPVSYAGLSSHGAELRRAAGDRIIIEDASHTLGGERADGSKVGSPGWADMTVLSFHPVKPITTAEGGAVVTESDDLAQKLRLLRSHGIERAPERLVEPGHQNDPWYYEQQVLGFNYRISDLQAALGASQLKRIDAFMERRRDIARRYDAHFADRRTIRLFQSDPADRRRSGHHVYVVGLDYDAMGLPRAEVMKRLRGRNVGSQVHYIPVHQQPYHRDRLDNARERFAHSDAFYAQALSIPCFPDMTDGEVDHVADAVIAVTEGRM